MQTKRRHWNSTVALAAAWFLVLQSLLGTFTLAVWPQTMQLDAFGNVICTHQGISKLPEGNAPTVFPDCCLLGCNWTTPALSDTPSLAILQVTYHFKDLTFGPKTADHLSFARQRSPANPRAPPILV